MPEHFPPARVLLYKIHTQHTLYPYNIQKYPCLLYVASVRKENIMEITPLRDYPTPEYPTTLEFHRYRQQLFRYIPRRWRFERTIGVVLSFTILSGLCACSLHKESQQTDAISVPLFVHGAGRGSYGCESVAPPVYLSEDEAAQVIRETAKEYGLDLTGEGKVTGDKLPYTTLFGQTNETYKGELSLDGYDEATGLGYLFVSRDDVAAWQKDTGVYASVETYDMKDTATRLSDTVKNTAVFYDPGTDTELLQEYFFGTDTKDPYSEENLKAYAAAQKAQMEEKLRAQVMDFIAWLQAQGII